MGGYTPKGFLRDLLKTSCCFAVSFLFRSKDVRGSSVAVPLPNLTESSEIRHIIVRINQANPQKNLLQVFVDCKPYGTVAVPHSFRDFGTLEATAVRSMKPTFFVL